MVVTPFYLNFKRFTESGRESVRASGLMGNAFPDSVLLFPLDDVIIAYMVVDINMGCCTNMVVDICLLCT